MDYSFEAIDDRGFEHMVQALCLAALGPGVGVFGDGRDGGREATYSGELSLPAYAGGESWSGYTVIQAKHRRRLSDPASNLTWLRSRVKEELDLWLPTTPEKRRRKSPPEYYLLITNVTLSSVPESGGIDAISTLMDGYRTSLGLKGWAVWHRDQVSRLLDNEPDVRRTYLGAITPGDILAAILEAYEGGPVTDVAAKVAVNAATELRERQWLRLGESGVEDGTRLSLAQVAMDVPANYETGDPDAEPERLKAVAEIVAAGQMSMRKSARQSRPNGIILVGGPGQGKSTVAQIVCQAYRSALLEGNSSLSPRQQETARATRGAIRRMGIEIPTYRRWPAFVELSRFADALSERPSLSLAGYLGTLARSESGALIRSDISRWLRTWPSLIVLDGLDEVPNPYSRDAVLRALDEFITEANTLDLDMMIVGTTRPQGYRGEFDEFEVRQLELLELTEPEAISYGRTLISALHDEDPIFRDDLLSRLAASAQDDATHRLITSPLQVTIMTTLIERLKRLPDTRHALFEGYYDAIYARETVRAGRLGEILARHRPIVDYVHEQVALAAHMSAAEVGGAESTVSRSALNEIIESELAIDGFESGDAERLARDLATAVRNRLVLLVSPRGDEVGFEVRSIQEYMAARAITTGPDADVVERLATTIPSSHWRNVWLFAAGRVLARSRHLVDALLSRLREADDAAPILRVAAPGERLAHYLLADGFASHVPALRRALVRHSLEAFSRWPDRQMKQLSVLLATEVDSDQQVARMVTDAARLALAGGGKGSASAVLVLQPWMKLRGRPAAIANGELTRSRGWRPDGSVKRPVETLRAVMHRTLYPDHSGALESLFRGTKDVQLSTNLLAAEVARYARVGTYPSVQLASVTAAISDGEVAPAVVAALDALDLADGQAGVFLRQAAIDFSESSDITRALREHLPKMTWLQGDG